MFISDAFVTFKVVDQFMAACATFKAAGITPWVEGDKDGYGGAWFFSNVGIQTLDSTDDLRQAAAKFLFAIKEAGEVYRRWLALEPLQPELRMEAIRHFDAMGRKDIALELARDGVRVLPRSGEARLALGMALHEAGRERQSLAEIRHAQELLPQPEQRTRIGALVGAMRAHAPDSLRALFAADSVRYESPGAVQDSVFTPVRK